MAVNVLSFNGKTLGTNVLDVYMVDVGQGNLIIVKFSDGTYMLVDAGMGSMGSSGVGPTPDEVVATVDTIMGDNNFTTVVITHADGDHYNMIPNFTQAANPPYVHIGGAIADYSIEDWFKNLTGQVYTYDQNYFQHLPNPNFGTTSASIYILAANVEGDKNAGSLVLLIEYGDVKLILPGDATFGTEAFILANWAGAWLGSVMLLVSHHGSNGSSGADFLAAVKPNVAMLSTGAYNYNFKHPRTEVIDRLMPTLDVENTTPPANNDMGIEGGICSIPMHRLDYFVPAQENDDENAYGDFVCEQLDHAIYSTGSIFNTLFQTDGAVYSATADTVGAACEEAQGGAVGTNDPMDTSTTHQTAVTATTMESGVEQ